MDIKNKKYHFIAIGGVGMSALAKYLAQRGAKVSGTDITESKYTKQLEQLGVQIHIGHNKKYIEDGMIVVASTAIRSDNPEIIRAKELGLKIYHRSDVLKLISDEFADRENAYFIGFSGTHGKTTTSGLCSYILEKCGYNPSFVVGGIIPEIYTNGKYESDKYFLAELDESDGTIKKYKTDIALINNIEEDHLDFYKNGFSDITKTFNEYLSNNKKQKVIINIDNVGCLKFKELYPNYNYITFGLKNADYTAREIKTIGLGSSFKVYYKENLLTELLLSIPGEHNIYNALGVIAVLNELNINIEKTIEHFKTFSGMGRRFQKVSEYNGIEIFDDYAHHPSEIKTTLKSAKDAVKNKKRILAIFQPHRYSRLSGLWDDFKKAFDYADVLYITDVYSAGEDPIEGITSEIFAKEINKENCKYISGDIKEVARKIYRELKKDDIVLTLGAGTITQLGKQIENMLKGKYSD